MLPIVFGVMNDKNDSRVDDFRVMVGVAMSYSLLWLTGVDGIGDNRDSTIGQVVAERASILLSTCGGRR